MRLPWSIFSALLITFNMADFNAAADFVLTGGLVNEGGYEPASPEDPGGETKFGISKRAYPNLNIKDLTPEDAKAIWHKDHWRFDAVRDQTVASKLLDITVNAGLTGGTRWIQRSLVMFFPGEAIAIDGVVGTRTIEMINSCDVQRLLCELRARQVQRYVEDLQRNPAELPLAMGLWRRASK